MASFTERYHESTKYNPYSIDKLGQAHWEEQPVPFRQLNENHAIGLNSFLPFLGKNIDGAAAELNNAPSASQWPSMHNLAWLLQFTVGITGVAQSESGPVYFRANPSAGGLYPVDLFFALRDWDGLPDGLYHFHPLICAAVPLLPGNLWPDFMQIFCARKVVESSNLIFLFTADLRRSEWRYRERSYRRILLDTGCAVANSIHHAQVQNVATRLLGGFRDNALQDLLQLQTEHEFPLLGLAISPHLQDPPQGYLHPPSLPPSQAVTQLCSSRSLQRCQHQVECIPEAFLPPGPAPEPEQYLHPAIALEVCEADHDSSNSTPQLLRALARRSCRHFIQDNLKLKHLGALLDLTYRPWLRDHLCANHLKHWIIAHQVQGLQGGIYRYQPGTHTLHLHYAGNLRAALHEIGLGQELGKDSSALLLHTANLSNATHQFGDRAYRYLKMDAGMLGEGVNLHCARFQLGSSGLGGYFDDLCNKTLHLSPTESILYLTAIGTPNSV